ncbi:MAG: hypothetical protein EOO48_09260 [Flavobacterium sp.]|nr:MAG: hypothetical protein EOO48_09260 [Flavobacterium sp.]
MYVISDAQIEFISNDISTRGIAMASLQHDLLDHICCVIEREFSENEDFEQQYLAIISRFYHTELSEIETETIHLLTNKNYYTMKKTMIASGVLSVGVLTAGIVLKFLHLPGAAALLVVGIFVMSFIFLPLMFILRAGEKQEKSQKIIAVIGGICAMLITLGVLFKVQHWPGANMMSTLSLLMMIFGFIPVYFFSGFRNPATKLNTIVTSIMMFTGCILILTLIRAPHATRNDYVQQTRNFIISDQTVKNEKRLADAVAEKDPQSEIIYQKCESLKTFLLQSETGLPKLDGNFEKKDALIGDSWTGDYFSGAPSQMRKLDELKAAIDRYNNSDGTAFRKVDTNVFELRKRVQSTLLALNQIQLTVLQNRRELVAMQ